MTGNDGLAGRAHPHPNPPPEGEGTGAPARLWSENTEELAVTLAASLAQRMMDLALPVGMAVNAENGRLLRPDHGPDHLSRMMETLASAQAAMPPETLPLPEFLYSCAPSSTTSTR